MARPKPLFSGDILPPGQRCARYSVAAADLLNAALGPSLLLRTDGTKIDGNDASLLLWDDSQAQAHILALARQVAAGATPAAADITTARAPVRRFRMHALLLSGEDALIWCSGTEMSLQDHLIEALKDSRKLFRDLAEAAGDFCAEVDPHGIIGYVSPTGALGHAAWALNGQPLSSLSHDASLLVAPVQMGPRDIQAIDAQGGPRILSVVAAPVFAHGTWTGTRFIARDVTDERAMTDAMHAAHACELRALEQLSRTDALTGLGNRRAFEDEVQRRVASLERHDGAGSLLLLDMDHFKTLNDTLGHAAGDDALKRLAARLGDILRETDLVARLGGDEFAIWLDGASALGAERVAANITEAVISIRQLCGGGLVPLSVSIGIAEWHRGIDDMQILMRRADDALYAVKRAGRGGFQVWKDI